MKEPFLKSLKKEIGMTRDYLAGEAVDTIYFGGGTPSFYRPLELQELMTPPPGPLTQKELKTPPPDPPPQKGGGESEEGTLGLNPEEVTEG